MIIGVPKEIKPQEHRIGLTPNSVKVLIEKGHKVLVETNGGYEAGFSNQSHIGIHTKHHSLGNLKLNYHFFLVFSCCRKTYLTYTKIMDLLVLA